MLAYTDVYCVFQCALSVELIHLLVKIARTILLRNREDLLHIYHHALTLFSYS